MNKKFKKFNSYKTYPIFQDIFENKFDETWMHGISDKVFTIIPPEIQNNVTDDGSVVYNFNKQKFRCDDFTENHNGKHVLFSGCSETEGVGGNIEDAWSKILYDRLAIEEKCSGFFNLSRSGWGWSRIVINALIYFEKYGYPDLYFIMLPNHFRKFIYFEDKDSWRYVQKYPPSKWQLARGGVEFLTEKEYNEDFISFVISWKMFNDICKNNNVKLLFSTWDVWDRDNIYDIKIFDNFIHIESGDVEKYSKKYYLKNDIKKDDYRKRDGHGGRVMHHFWADEFYKRYRDLND